MRSRKSELPVTQIRTSRGVPAEASGGIVVLNCLDLVLDLVLETWLMRGSKWQQFSLAFLWTNSDAIFPKCLVEENFVTTVGYPALVDIHWKEAFHWVYPVGLLSQRTWVWVLETTFHGCNFISRESKIHSWPPQATAFICIFLTILQLGTLQYTYFKK